MNSVMACPDRDTLQQLLLGQLPPPRGEQLAQHLEECPHCSTVVESLSAEDTLVEAIRAQATPGDGPETESVRRLIERLRQPEIAAVVMSSNDTPMSDTDESPPTDARLADMVSPSAVTNAMEGGEAFAFLSPPQEPGEIGRLGSYRVLKVLGSGGMGVVFQAEDVQLRRLVALKVMRPDVVGKAGARERFLREARAAAGLTHDHIVAIYQVGEENGVPFIAMQWLRGRSLEERLKQGGPVSIGEALRLGRQIALGLSAAHAAGLIHRDIKLDNLWLEARPNEPEALATEERVKILDFGLARPVEDDAHLTGSGTIVGTPSYLAPEQARGERVDDRCDLFSLGVVLYRLCTGQLPFQGDTTMAVLTALATESPRPACEVNPAVPAAAGQPGDAAAGKEPSGATGVGPRDRRMAPGHRATACAGPRRVTNGGSVRDNFGPRATPGQTATRTFASGIGTSPTNIGCDRRGANRAAAARGVLLRRDGGPLRQQSGAGGDRGGRSGDGSDGERRRGRLSAMPGGSASLR